MPGNSTMGIDTFEAARTEFSRRVECETKGCIHRVTNYNARCKRCGRYPNEYIKFDQF